MGKKNTNNAKPGVMIYFEILPQLEMLKPLQRLAIYEAIMAYGRDRTEPVLKREAELAWAFIRPILDRDDERYRRTIEGRSKGGKAKAAKTKKQMEAQNSAESCSGLLKSAEACSTCQSTISNPQSTISNLQSSNINPQSTDGNLQSANNNTQSPPYRESAHFTEDVGITGGGFVAPSFGEVRDFVLKEGLRFDPEDFTDYYTANGWIIGGVPMKDWKAVARRWGRRERENGRSEEFLFGNYG